MRNFYYANTIDLSGEKYSWFFDKDFHDVLKINKLSDKTLFKVTETDKKRSLYYSMTDAPFDYQPNKLKNSCIITQGDYQAQINVTKILNENLDLDLDIWIYFYNDENKKVTSIYSKLYNNFNTIDFIVPPNVTSFKVIIRFSGYGSVEIEPIVIKTNIDLQNTDVIHNFFNKLNNSNEILSDMLKKAYEKNISLEYSTEYKVGKTFSNFLQEPFKSTKNFFKIRKSYKKGNPLTLRAEEKLSYLIESINKESGFGVDNKEIYCPEFIPKVKPKSVTYDINIGVILDQFSFDSFKYEANYIKLSKKNWKKELIDNDIKILFLESVWSGNNDEWKFMMTSIDKPFAQPLVDLVTFAKKKKIPVVFWNKEDPVNFDVFIEFAKMSDYIFTTDDNMVSKYKSIVKHNNVYSLMFAAQPLIHNPIRDKKLEVHEVCFAGSWYNTEKFNDRKKFTSIVLDGADKFELNIFDRMYSSKKDTKNRKFPDKYQKYIVGSLEYTEMLTAYRQYKVFLNVNSVFESDTMFSRRIFELLACGTLIVSSKSKGLKRLFSKYVDICTNSDQVTKAITRCLDNNIENSIKKHLGMREVFLNHTYSHRMKRILSKLDIQVPEVPKKVSVITVTNRIDYLDNVIKNYKGQGYFDKELILVLNSLDFDVENVRSKFIDQGIDVKVISTHPDISLGGCFNQGYEVSDGNYIAKMDDDDIYGSNYLIDMIHAFDYSNADLVGKWTTHTHLESTGLTYERFAGRENIYCDFVTGATMMMKKAVMESVKFTEKNRGEDSQYLIDVKKKGFIIFSSDKYNFIIMRRKDISKHTWEIDESEYLDACTNPSNGLDEKRVLI
jgi:spore maturation protein CgeB